MKVVMILSRSALAIMVANEQVDIGDMVEVYSPGPPIFDPESGDELGTLDKSKAILKVVQVFPKFFVAENAETQTRLHAQFVQPLSNISEFYSHVPRSLNVNPEDVVGNDWKSDEPIQLGDPVRLIKKVGHPHDQGLR